MSCLVRPGIETEYLIHYYLFCDLSINLCSIHS
jgi:hypothetical protein